MGQTLSNSFVWNRSHAADVAPTPVAAEPVVAMPFERSKRGVTPVRATEGAAGYDLHSAEGLTLSPYCGWTKVKTGIKIAIVRPEIDTYTGHETTVFGAIRSRSGLAAKGIDAFHGTIDGDYRGEIVVMLKNSSNQDFEIKVGDRIAQLVFMLALLPQLIEVEAVEADTERGDGGFGSTGVEIEVAEQVAADDAEDGSGERV